MFRDFPGGPVAKPPHSNAGGPGSTPGQGTRSHMLQLRVHMPQLKILCATTKTQHSQKKNTMFNTNADIFPCRQLLTNKNLSEMKY